MRHFEAYGFLNPIIIQRDKEMSIVDVCRKVAREQNARTVLRFAPKTSHQSNGFVEAVHGHVQGLARCYQTQIETDTGIQFLGISLAIPIAISYAGFVLSRFAVRPDGRTPFQYFLGTPYVSHLCMFGESVFALIPDQEVRAAKLTNMWISGCFWARDASSYEHLVETKHGLLKCRPVCRKPPGEQWSQRETIEARGTKWNFDVEMDSGVPGPPVTSRPDEGMPTATARVEIPTVPPPAPPPVEHVPEMRGHSIGGGGEVAAKTEIVICDPSYTDPAKTKVISKVVRYTNILAAFVPDLLNEVGKLIDTGQIIIAQILLECKNDIYVMTVSCEHCVTSKDGYTLICAKPATLEIFWTQITKLVVIKRGEALNPRVPVTDLVFEYRSVHDGETYCQVRGRMLGHGSTAECKGSDDAFDGTEELESA